MREDELILVAGALLAGGLLASLVAVRLRIPSLVVFLGLGMAIGSDAAGLIDFNDYEVARTVGVIALALILFDGGLGTGFREIRPVLGAAISLAVAGTLITAAISGVVATWLFDLSLREGLLLGAIVSATDGAAIFALLRGSTLRRRVARALEGESGFNDALAVLLVVGLVEWLDRGHYGVADAAELFVRQLGLGALAGLGVGWLAVTALQRARLATAGLYPVASLAAAALAYGSAASLEGSGFLAVYLTGLVMGTAPIPAKQTVTNVHDGLAWVAQVSMFLALGLLVFPGQLPDVALEGTILAVALLFVARPIAASLATAPFGFNVREQIVLGWAGLRGAVPVVLATFPVIAGIPGSREFFNIVFFAVVLSTLVQGSTFQPLARRLGVTTNEPARPQPLAEAGTIRGLGAEVVEYPVADDDAVAGLRVRDLGLPREAVVNVIVRGDEAIPPRGSTRVRPGDRLHVLIRQEAANLVPELLGRWRTGPVGPRERPPRPIRAHKAIFSARPWEDDTQDASHPARIGEQEVVDMLRIRRDEPGALVVLTDGRYAVTSPLLAVGSRGDLSAWARRRLRDAHPDERAWLQTVVGALAADFYTRPE